jgi:hypothetical protein
MQTKHEDTKASPEIVTSVESWEVSLKNVLVIIYFYDFFMVFLWFWFMNWKKRFLNLCFFYDFLWFFYDNFMIFLCFVLWFFYDFFSAHVALIKPLKKS